MTRLLGLLALFVAILFVQAVALTEAFGSSQGGAQIQLAASRPIAYVAVPPSTLITSNLGISPLSNISTLSSITPGSLQIPQSQQASVSSWLSPY